MELGGSAGGDGGELFLQAKWSYSDVYSMFSPDQLVAYVSHLCLLHPSDGVAEAATSAGRPRLLPTFFVEIPRCS